MLPVVGNFAPDTEEFYQGLRNRSLEFYSDLDKETVTEDAIRVNGPDSLLAHKF